MSNEPIEDEFVASILAMVESSRADEQKPAVRPAEPLIPNSVSVAVDWLSSMSRADIVYLAQTLIRRDPHIAEYLRDSLQHYAGKGRQQFVGRAFVDAQGGLIGCSGVVQRSEREDTGRYRIYVPDSKDLTAVITTPLGMRYDGVFVQGWPTSVVVNIFRSGVLTDSAFSVDLYRHAG